MDYIYQNVLCTHFAQHARQFAANICITTASINDILIQLCVPVIGGTSWVAKAAREIYVFEHYRSFHVAGSDHCLETSLRLAQVAEQKTRIN